MPRISLLAPLAALAVAVVLACASGPPPPSQLTFVDSKIFDDQLHAALAAEHPAVTVQFMGSDVTVNQLPERLDTWLYLLVDRYEGKIQMTPDPSAAMSKGIEGIAMGLAVGAYKLATERMYHGPIKHYDATVYFIPGSGALTRVVFQRKPPS
ncbi:MAG: hypothetical protein ABFS41_02555 [Myxococcota bacterium]